MPGSIPQDHLKVVEALWVVEGSQAQVDTLAGATHCCVQALQSHVQDRA